MLKIKIEDFKGEYLEDVLAIFAEWPEVFPKDEQKLIKKDLEESLSAPKEVKKYFVALDSGRVVGIVGYVREFFPQDVYHFNYTAVKNELAGRGIGTQMLDFIEGELRKLNARLLLVETSNEDFNVATKKFYEKNGLRKVAVIPDFYADGDSGAIFLKRL